MRNASFFIFFIFVHFTLSAQEIVKIKVKSKKTRITEEFYVYKNNKTIKNGEYKKFDNGYLKINGFFKNNLKDSLWTEYSSFHYNTNSTSIMRKGNYLSDKKIGLWEFYDFNGDIIQKYDYSTNELIYDRILKADDTNKLYKIIIGNDTLYSKLDRTPIYIGGVPMLIETIFTNINYPSKAKEFGITGKVVISFIIDKYGKTRNHKILNTIGYGCDEEALRVVKDFLLDWVPAKLKDNNVDIEYTLPISFKID